MKESFRTSFFGACAAAAGILCSTSAFTALFGISAAASDRAISFTKDSPHGASTPTTSSQPSSAQPPAGQWTIVASPNTSDTQGNYLTAVTCASGSDCWAAGFYYDASNLVKTLLEHGTSAEWSIVQAPTPTNGPQDLLTAMTCVSSTNCWGVGYYEDTSLTVVGTVATLTEHFDGSSWSVVSSPNGQTGTTDSRLWSVSCPAASDCWAVGEYLAPGVFSLTPSSVYQTLIEHNTGGGWVVVSSPNVTIPVDRSDPTGQTANVLLGVSCTSQGNCWAVGWYYNAVGISQPLLEHYDGSVWSIVAGPNVGYSALEGMTCDSANDCWAVGFVLNENSSGTGTVSQMLIEHYDGTAWSIVTSPNSSSTDNNELFGVACASASNCWTVGFSYTDSSSPYRTLIEHYDGSAWSVVASPNTNDNDSDYLVGVACGSANDCLAVGYYFDAVGGHTLIEHYTAPVQLTSVASRMTHGTAGTFDVDITTGSGIECRSSGANGDYTIVFTFANPLSSVTNASVASGTGSVLSGSIDSSDAHNYIVSLTGVTNAQVITVALANVADSAGNVSPAVAGSMGVLIGDVNASGRVDAADVSSVRQQTLQVIDSSNFRNDINVSGRTDAADVSMVRQQTLTSLP